MHFEDPRVVLKRHGLQAKRSWGQNFLISQKAVEKISLDCVDEDNRSVLEIGAGLGTLTGALLSIGGRVTALERDPEMCAVLKSEFGASNNFRLEEADAAIFDYDSYLKEGPAVIAGNLPYQITGRILRRVMETGTKPLRVVFMVQLEVAQRLIACPGEKGRGALTVMLDARFEVKKKLTLPPTAFFPKPKVRSAVVKMIPRHEPFFGKLDEKLFDDVVKSSFFAKRKMIKNSLSLSGLVPAATADELLNCARISPKARAEELETSDFVGLARAFSTR